MIPDDEALIDEQSPTNDLTKGTKAFMTQPFPTLGKRLAREARRMVSHRIPVFPWLRPLETTMEHLTSLPAPAQERFQRIEAMPCLTSLPGAVMARRTSATYSPGAVTTSRPPASQADRSASPGATHASRPSRREADIQPFPAEGQPLPPHLQQRLQRFVGQSTESIRIHNDAASHEFARTQRADAVTIGQHIFFREGQFRPQEERGFALLTHEALHVVRVMQPGSAWRRATQFGIQEEEQEAAAVENRALEARHNASWEPAPLPPHPPFPAKAPMLPGRLPSHITEPAPLAVEAAASAPEQRPMKASIDRSIVSGAPPTTPDMEALKRSIYRDLMKQIKVDKERGA